MPNEQPTCKPRLYFLNERHQLAPAEKSSGGRNPNVLGVDWSAHGAVLKQGLVSLRAARQASADPTARNRAFVLAKPKDKIEKASKARGATDGKKDQPVCVDGKDAQLIERLGFDLLAVTEDGSAVVHASDERLKQMELSLENLESLGSREQNKWGHIQGIGEIPIEYKTSLSWWSEPAPKDTLLECVIDLQPHLKRGEVEAVISRISEHLLRGEQLMRTGKEFSGRVWLHGKLFPKTVLSLAENFQAIFSIHPPLGGIPIGPDRKKTGSNTASSASDSDPSGRPGRELPCVAVVDTGIPTDHILLGKFIRGTLAGENTGGQVCDSHGSKVGSRVVFGEVECDGGTPAKSLKPRCSIYDIRVGEGLGKIYPDAVEPAFGTLASAAPDVRVFNLSIDANTDVDALEGSYRDAWIRRIADLDNRIFSDDVVVVVAAGNSDPGVIPNPPYPRHLDDSQWRLRAWSRCFNAITCGGSADLLNPDGVANEFGAPSPFCRVGPGLAKSPKPDFSASAGNCGPDYRDHPGSGMGVWVNTDSGLWEDRMGTSYAAPLLARAAALTLAFLRERCEEGSKPFACLVKATLAIFARRADLSGGFRKLSDRTLGLGSVDFTDIVPTQDRAVFFWQGIIPTEDDLLTVELPVPGDWIRNASKPVLRLVAAWDTPVNHAAESVWACRKIDVTVRPADGHDAFRPKNRKGSAQYTWTKREYTLKKEMGDRDRCLVELRYSHTQMAPYPGRLDFSPQQRIGIAFELVDEGESPLSPHPSIQELPVSATLNRLSSEMPASRQAVSIKIS